MDDVKTTGIERKQDRINSILLKQSQVFAELKDAITPDIEEIKILLREESKAIILETTKKCQEITESAKSILDQCKKEIEQIKELSTKIENSLSAHKSNIRHNVEILNKNVALVSQAFVVAQETMNSVKPVVFDDKKEILEKEVIAEKETNTVIATVTTTKK